MAKQPDWGVNYLSAVQNLVEAIEAMRTYHDQMVQDPSLPDKYLETAAARSDLVNTDFVNSDSAVVQILFTFDSGNPTQKSYLFKML